MGKNEGKLVKNEGKLAKTGNFGKNWAKCGKSGQMGIIGKNGQKKREKFAASWDKRAQESEGRECTQNLKINIKIFEAVFTA